MSIIKDKTGGVRLAWRLLIVVLCYMAVAVLLRFVPIGLYTAVLVSGGVPKGNALVSASAIVFDDPVWSMVIAILNGLMSLPLVWVLIRAIERRGLVWKPVDVDWRRKSFLALTFGALLALLLYVADGASLLILLVCSTR